MAGRKRRTVLRTQTEVADHYRRSVRTVQSWFAAGCPGEPRRYVVEDIDEWLEAAFPDESDDDGENSEALEELRKWKAKREKLAYQRDLGQWIRRSDVHACLATFAAVLRQACEVLQKTFGREARDIIAEAVKDAESASLRALGPLADGDGDPLDQPTDHAAADPLDA